MSAVQKIPRWTVLAVVLVLLLSLVVCGRIGTPDVEGGDATRKDQVEAAQPVYCETHDCSGFPTGYYSINLNEQWLYIPTSDTIRKKTGAKGTWRTAVSGKNGFDFEERTGPTNNAETLQVLRDGLVIADGATLDFFHCCRQLSEYYGVEAMLDVSQARFSSFRTEGVASRVLASNPANILTAEDAPEAFQGIAERYTLQIRGFDDPNTEYVKIIAYSKGPLMLGGRVEISCLNLGCSISWSGNERDQFISGRLNSVFTRTPCNTPDNCLSRESIDAHFEKLERLIADFETVINLMKVQPETDTLPASEK